MHLNITHEFNKKKKLYPKNSISANGNKECVYSNLRFEIDIQDDCLSRSNLKLFICMLTEKKNNKKNVEKRTARKTMEK